jgi:predicted Abi (CAAX) family protease
MTTVERAPSNFERYRAMPFTQPDHYPLDRIPDPARYKPVAEWIGRLILPALEERRHDRGVFFEVHHAPKEHAKLVGQTVVLAWSDAPAVQARVWGVTRDVRFTAKARASVKKGVVHPERVDQWPLVGPLESLAAGHPSDDIIVALAGPVAVATEAKKPVLRIEREPVQITGRYVGLVRFVGPANDDTYRVQHYSPAEGAFSGPEDLVRMPVPANDSNDTAPFTNEGIERSPLNDLGWYVYGAEDADGHFVVQAIGPRALFRLVPDEVKFGSAEAWRYVRSGMWKDASEQKGRTSSVLISGSASTPDAAVAAWREGDQALFFHTYGGIGGKKREPAARAILYWGHFAFGEATVVHDPLSNEPIFDIVYHQVYTHNVDGLVAGTLHWSRYVGDRQFGWAGVRPIGDILIRWEPFTRPYDFGVVQRSGLGDVRDALEAMEARYRIGDGTGGTYVGAANNCAQDSAAAFYAAIRRLDLDIVDRPAIRQWLIDNPAEGDRLKLALAIGPALRRRMSPTGTEREDWKYSSSSLEISQQDNLIRGMQRAFVSWRTMLPRLAAETIMREFINRGADVWVLRASQIGGDDPDIAPIAPMTI